MNLNEKMSEKIDLLASAISKAQGEIKGAIKDSKNPFFQSNYADLSSVWESCRAPLAKNNLAVVQLVDHAEDARNGERVTILESILIHSSGQWMRSVLPIYPIDTKPQSIGSAITYARRYSLMAIVGISPEDDDGNAASGKIAAMTLKSDPKTVTKPDIKSLASTIKTQVQQSPNSTTVSRVTITPHPSLSVPVKMPADLTFTSDQPDFESYEPGSMG